MAWMLPELLALGLVWQSCRRRAKIRGLMPPGLASAWIPPGPQGSVLLEPSASLEWIVEGPGWVWPWTGRRRPEIRP